MNDHTSCEVWSFFYAHHFSLYFLIRLFSGIGYSVGSTAVKDNIFISVKLDTKKSKYYVATVFDVKQSKIDSYVRSGRLIKIDVEKDI